MNQFPLLIKNKRLLIFLLSTIFSNWSFAQDNEMTIEDVYIHILDDNCIEKDTHKIECFKSIDFSFGILNKSKWEKLVFIKLKNSNNYILIKNYDWNRSAATIDTLGINLFFYAYNSEGEILWMIMQIGGLIEAIKFYNTDSSKYDEQLYSNYFDQKSLGNLKIKDLIKLNDLASQYNFKYDKKVINYYLKDKVKPFSQ